MTEKEYDAMVKASKSKKTNYSLKPLKDLDELEGKALKYLAARGTKT